MSIFVWGLIFLIAVIITGIMGFKKPRGNPTARIFFYIFLIIFLALLGYGLYQKYSHKLPVPMQMRSDDDNNNYMRNNGSCS